MGRNSRILLVEDNPDDAFLLRARLTAFGGNSFKITHVVSLAAAIAKFDKDSYDIMILDLDLPDSSGLDTIERAAKALPEAKILVLSGRSRDETAAQALAHGAIGYMEKDMTDEILGDIISRAASRPGIAA